MIDLSVIIPAYNESENLQALTENLAPLYKPNIEIIIVDNGSTDDTQAKISALNLRINNIRFIRKEVNTGYGAGILYGLKKANGKVLAWTHADLQTNPLDVLEAYNIFAESEDQNLLVKGTRKRKFGISVLLSWGMQTFASIVLKTSLTEINAQPKLFSRQVYKEFILHNPPTDFSLDLFLIYFFLKSNYQVQEFSVKFDTRYAGDAKGGGSNIFTVFKISLRTVAYILKLKKLCLF